MSVLDLYRKASEGPLEDPLGALREAEAEARVLLEVCEGDLEDQKKAQERNVERLRGEMGAEVVEMEAVKRGLAANAHQRVAVRDARDAVWQARLCLNRARREVRGFEAERTFAAPGRPEAPGGVVLEFRR